MNKEEIIKYIFDEENYSNFISSQNGGEQYYILLEKEESKILKDYISNLQDRIDKVIDTLEKRINEIKNQEWKSYTGQTDEEYLEEQEELLNILKGE